MQVAYTKRARDKACEILKVGKVHSLAEGAMRNGMKLSMKESIGNSFMEDPSCRNMVCL